MDPKSGICTTIKVAKDDGWILGYVHHDGHVSALCNGEMTHFPDPATLVKDWPESPDGSDPQ